MLEKQGRCQDYWAVLNPLDGRTLEALLQRADEALYRVKSTDKGSYQLYLAGGTGSPTVA